MIGRREGVVEVFTLDHRLIDRDRAAWRSALRRRPVCHWPQSVPFAPAVGVGEDCAPPSDLRATEGSGDRLADGVSGVEPEETISSSAVWRSVCDRLLQGLLIARQLDDDLIIAARLDHRLADAEAADAALDRVARAGQLVRPDRLTRHRTGLQEDLQPPLQVEPLPDRQVLLPAQRIERGTRSDDPARQEAEDDNTDEDIPRSEAQGSTLHCA